MSNVLGPSSQGVHTVTLLDTRSRSYTGRRKACSRGRVKRDTEPRSREREKREREKREKRERQRRKERERHRRKERERDIQGAGGTLHPPTLLGDKDPFAAIRRELPHRDRHSPMSVPLLEKLTFEVEYFRAI
jgi:hypothetical protein